MDTGPLHKKDVGAHAEAVEAQVKIVHESEGQRQYPRVQLPAKLMFAVNGDQRVCELYDLSAGGFSFEARNQHYRIGDAFSGELSFSIDEAKLAIPVEFCISAVDAGKHRVGCTFRSLGQRQVSVLRHIVSAYVSGQMVTVGEMLTTIGRNNFMTERKLGGIANAELGLTARVRAAAITLAVLIIGVFAFVYTVGKLYDLLLLTHSAAAKVSAPVFTVTMPRDGTFFSLVPENGVVKKGAPLGTFETAMLDVVRNDPGALHLPPDQLATLLGQQLKGTVTSPCDCRVHRRYATDAQYVNHNQPLFELLPDGNKPYVLARFHYDQISELTPGRLVRFRINGQGRDLKGRVGALRTLPAPVSELNVFTDLSGLNNSSTSTDVIAEIEPLQPLDDALIDAPVDVRMGGLVSLLALF